MIHYHGTPITPNAVLYSLAGRCFCVSHARPEQVARVHEIGQSVMLDNGAFAAASSCAFRLGKVLTEIGAVRVPSTGVRSPLRMALTACRTAAAAQLGEQSNHSPRAANSRRSQCA